MPRRHEKSPNVKSPTDTIIIIRPKLTKPNQSIQSYAL